MKYNSQERRGGHTMIIPSMLVCGYMYINVATVTYRIGDQSPPGKWAMRFGRDSSTKST